MATCDGLCKLTFDVPVDIRIVPPEPDSFGGLGEEAASNHPERGELVFSTWAHVKQFKGSEPVSQGRRKMVRMYRLTMDWDPRITEGMYITVNGSETYDVGIENIDNVEEQDVYLVIDGKRGAILS